MKGKTVLICMSHDIARVRLAIESAKMSESIIVVEAEKSIPIFEEPRPLLIHAPQQFELPSMKVILKEELKVTQQWSRKNQYSGKKNFKKKRR